LNYKDFNFDVELVGLGQSVEDSKVRFATIGAKGLKLEVCAIADEEDFLGTGLAANAMMTALA
jgi:hypothetical protein